MTVALPDVAAAADFPTAAGLVLRYLHDHLPLDSWSITRVDGDRQTFLLLDGDNGYGLRRGDVVSWQAGFCVRMVAPGSPLVAPDLDLSPEYRDAAVRSTLTVRTYAGAPVHEADGRLFGSICGLDPSPQAEGAALREAGPVLQLLGQLLSMTLRADRARAEVEAMAEARRYDAETDALTGLPNRRAWERLLSLERAAVGRFQDSSAVVIMDLDRLKDVNDREGHVQGDDYLRRAACALTEAARDSDVTARLGGDEFGLLLRRCLPADVERAVSRLGEALERFGVSASLGWAQVEVGDGVLGAVERADAAMYTQKRARREAETGRLLV